MVLLESDLKRDVVRVHFWVFGRHIEDVADAVTSFASLSPMSVRLFVESPDPPLAFALRTDLDHSPTEDFRWVHWTRRSIAHGFSIPP